MFVSIGNSRMDKKFNCTDMTYEDFVSRLSKTKYTAETMEQYRKMPKGQQDNIKDVGGFVLGKLKGGRRKKDCVISRSAITLDMNHQDSCTGRALPVTVSMCFRKLKGTKLIPMKCCPVIRTGMMYQHGRSVTVRHPLCRGISRNRLTRFPRTG